MSFDNFWGFVNQHPHKVAIVDADEQQILQADLLASVNQLSHGLRGLGLERGDSIAAMLPNSREALELYLAMQQIGVYLTPINFHLVGPEIAYILHDSEAQVFIAHAKYADALRAALEETGFPRDRVFSVGAIDGLQEYDQLKKGQPTRLPSNRE